MDLKKTGIFIAAKRKEKGYTQAKLGELLGVTNKAVSKWERGVCLPDVGLYTQLCSILDITVNELFAGEELDEVQFKQKADRNLADIARAFTRRGRRMQKLCAILLIALLITATVAGGFVIKSLKDSGYFKANYIKPYAFDEEGELLSNVLKESGESPYVFEFKTDSSVYGIRIKERVYENGKLTREDVVLENGMEGKAKGYIVIKVRKNAKTSINGSTEKGSFALDDRKVSDSEYEMFASAGLMGLRELLNAEIVLVGAYYTNEDELTVPAEPKKFVAEEQIEELKGVDCYVLYSCQFIR